MKKIETMRETLSSLLTPEYLKQREEAGWRPVSVEWQREVTVMEPQAATTSSEGEIPRSGTFRHGEEIPYGLHIADDCRHLEDNAAEMQVLKLLAELIVQDLSFPQMAEALNYRGLRTRDGQLWTPLAVFKLTPRLIDVTPRILTGPDWASRKKELTRVAWNS